MRPFVRPFISKRRERFGSRGAVALLLVLGISAVLLLIIAALNQRAGSSLHLVSAETTALSVRQAINSTLNDLAAKAEAYPDDFIDSEVQSGVGLCTPRPFFGSSHPYVCRQVLPQRTVTMSDMNSDWPYDQVIQYPVRVVWQASPNAPEQVTYAWLVIDPNLNPVHVMGIWAARQWCQADPNYYIGDSDNGFCRIGG